MSSEDNKFEYSCQNQACQYAVLKGYKILLSQDAVTICPYCKQTTLKRTSGAESGTRSLAGAGGGALLGWAVGGPLGAIVGGFLGLLAGSAAEENERHVRPKK